MSKRLILILALAFVVGLCATTYAAVQNVKVSGDLKILGVGRNAFQLDDTLETETAILSIVRARIDADLTDNVAATIRLINEREWGEEGTATSDIDLDLAYVTLKEFLYSPLSLVLGRQELRFGNGLIIGDPDTNNRAAATGNLSTTLTDLSSRKAFDAVKAILNYDPLIVDLIYSKVDENTTTVYDDVDLYGVNASYALRKDTLLEGYYFQKTRDRETTYLTTAKSDIVRTLGTRGVYTGIKDLALSLEYAYQLGRMSYDINLYPNESGLTAGNSYRRRAWALQAGANYAFSGVKYNPALGASFTHLSGQKQGNTKDRYTGWDAMFEDQSGGTIFNKIMGFSNCNLTNVNASIKPMEDVKLTLNYYNILLDKKYLAGGVNLNGLQTDDGGIAFTMKNKRHLADEVDLGLTYDYTEDVQFGLSGGAFIPAGAFDKTNKKTASQVIGSMKVTF